MTTTADLFVSPGKWQRSPVPLQTNVIYGPRGEMIEVFNSRRSSSGLYRMTPDENAEVVARILKALNASWKMGR